MGNKIERMGNKIEFGRIRVDSTEKEIKEFEKMFNIPLLKSEYDVLKSMNSKQCYKWARDNKIIEQKKKGHKITLDERLQSLERKLDRIFRNAALVNGKWINFINID